jgi:hypothetical protein
MRPTVGARRRQCRAPDPEPPTRPRRGSPSRMIGRMSVPGRLEAAHLLLSLEPPAWQLRHARAVAEVAAFLAFRAVAAGRRVDRGLAEVAALLHDADKAVPAGDPVRSLPHGAGSAAWLTARGHPELAAAVAGHPVSRLAASDADTWLDLATAEELLVAYADKRAGQRCMSMTGRFADWTRRYPASANWQGLSGADATRVRQRAARLETAACALAGVSPPEVRRLRWTGRVLVAARASRVGTVADPGRHPGPDTSSGPVR